MGVKIYTTVCGALVLFEIGVVKVAVLLPRFKLPLAVATTPAGIEAVQTKVDGLMLEVTVITALPPEHIGPTDVGDVAMGKGLTKIVAVDVAAAQGPAGSLVVNVSRALPVNPDGGDQVEDAEFVLENVPPTFDDQVTLDAAPPNVPFNEMDCPAHTPFG